ncbi:MAG: LON peptidase substrate-binding domain-containing protein [Candidatus Poribacteria bacterium]|nr:LON peptidase substrate-binding domain-containing protein [Candidatus Poribacteria bacterium]
MESITHMSIFPLNTVLYPGMALPLHIFEERYISMIGECLSKKQPFGVVLIRKGEEVGGPAKVHTIGTVAEIERSEQFDDGRYGLLCVGGSRFRIEEITQERPFMKARVEMLPELTGQERVQETTELANNLRRELASFERLSAQIDPEWEKPTAVPPMEPSGLAYSVAAVIPMRRSDKQRLLSMDSLSSLLSHEIDEIARYNFRCKAVLAAREQADQFEKPDEDEDADEKEKNRTPAYRLN